MGSVFDVPYLENIILSESIIMKLIRGSEMDMFYADSYEMDTYLDNANLRKFLLYCRQWIPFGVGE